MDLKSKPVLRSEEFRRQVNPENPKRPFRGSIIDSFKKFMDLKRQSPATQYGASDKPFKSMGSFGSRVSGLSHAHLSQDISIVYKIENGKIYLYGFYSHDQLGTGQPANINKQQSMATRFSNMNFSE